MAGQADNPDSVRRDVRANTVRMPEDLWQALQAEAERTGLSTSELIRQAVSLRLAFIAVERAAAEGEDVGAAIAAMLRGLDV
jgi:predicted transcriptional regulator